MTPAPATQPTRSKRGRPADDYKRQDKDRGLYHCDYCHKDLSHVPRIKCAVCPDFDLCLECFSVGAQIYPHSNDHAYRVVDNLSFPLYHPEWGADEELLLLEAVDMYGLGNWGPDPLHRNSVADHVGMKGGPECRAHYFSVYIDTDCFPEPKPAPEMAGIDIHKLIAAHRSSGQTRMTAPARGHHLPPPKKPRPPQPAGAAAAAGAAGTAAAAAAAPAPSVVKPEAGGEAAAAAVVKHEGPEQQAQQAQQQQQAQQPEIKLEPGRAVPMEVDVKAEPEAAPAGTAGTAAAAAAGGAAGEPPPPPHPPHAHPPPHPPAGDKGRKHAAAKHHVAAPSLLEAAGGGGTGAGGEALGPPEEPHHTTANFGLRLRRAASSADDLAGAAGREAGGGTLGTPAAALVREGSVQGGLSGLGGGGAAGGKSPAEGGGAGAGGGAALPAGAAGAGPGGLVVGTSDAQQTGYHVKRNEFDPEYDNDAETVVAELEFNPEDTPEQIQAKLRLVEIYNKRLDERDRRKAFVLERGLINVRKQQAADRRRTAAERELQARLRVFARYLPQDQFEALAEGMAVEARLRARVQELSEYRAAGLRTFEQVDALEAVLGEGARKKAEAEKPPPTSRTKPQRVQLDEGAVQSELLQLGLPHAAAALDTLRTTLNEGKGTSSALQAWRSRRGALLDITSLPDVDPLTQKERALCATERYLPAQYLAVKAALLRVQDVKGHVSRADVAQLPFKVDPARLLRLLDFFVQQGWVVHQGR